MLYNINNIYSNFLDIFNTKKKQTLNKNNQFAVKIDNLGLNFQTLIQHIIGLNITIAGDGTNEAKRIYNTFGNINAEDYIFFGGSTRFDAEVSTRYDIANSISEEVTVYSISTVNNLQETIQAIYEFKEKKEELIAKYPRNRVSSTMKELTLMENDTTARKKAKKKTKEIRVFPNFCIDSFGNVINRNLSDDVLVVQEGETPLQFRGSRLGRNAYRNTLIIH